MYSRKGSPPDCVIKLCDNWIFKALLWINPFSTGILWKIGITKKAKHPTLNASISKSKTNSERKLTFSESLFNFLQNSVVFCTFYPRGYPAGGSARYNPWCRCQRLAVLKELMMRQEKFWISFFCLFLLDMSSNFRKTAIFHFWAKVMLLLNPFSTGILWKIDIIKKAKHPILNASISKSKTKSEWKLKFSESLFNFLQNSVVFCTFYPRGYPAEGSARYNPWCRCQWLAVLKELRIHSSPSILL